MWVYLCIIKGFICCLMSTYSVDAYLFQKMIAPQTLCFLHKIWVLCSRKYEFTGEYLLLKFLFNVSLCCIISCFYILCSNFEKTWSIFGTNPASFSARIHKDEYWNIGFAGSNFMFYFAKCVSSEILSLFEASIWTRQKTWALLYIWDMGSLLNISRLSLSSVDIRYTKL